METGETDSVVGTSQEENKVGKSKREQSQQFDVRSAVLRKEELPPFAENVTDPLQVFVRRVLPRLHVVLATYGDVGEEPEEALQQAILTLSTQRRELDGQDNWTGGALHLKSMLYWRKRQRGICDAVDRTLIEILSERAIPRSVKGGLKENLERWIDDLPPRCRTRLKVRYGLAVDSHQISLKVDSRRLSVRKITGRCLQALSVTILREGLTDGIGPES